jgi:hypothetical protein
MLESHPKALAVTKWTRRGWAIVGLVAVVTIYWHSWSVGSLPAGHPWSGLGFVTIAAALWANSLTPDPWPFVRLPCRLSFP